MKRTVRKASAEPITAPSPAVSAGWPGSSLNAVGEIGGLAAEWQRLAMRAWSDFGRQAETGRAEITEAQWPAQAWQLQMELLTAQAAGLARVFEEALVAGLDLQTRWFRQFETLGLSGLQAWLPAEGRTGGVPTGAFGAWADWQQQMLSALRHDVESERAAP